MDLEVIIIKDVLCLLCKAKFDEIDAIKIKSELALIKDKKLLFNAIVKNSVHVLVIQRLKEYFKDWYKINFSELQKEFFDKIINNDINRFKMQDNYLDKVIYFCEKYSIPIVLLKGSCFKKVLYSDNLYKKMNDVDVLIDKNDAQHLIEILTTLKFKCVFNNFELDENIFEQTHHAPPFVSFDGKCIIGIHWNLSSSNKNYKYEIPFIWKRKEKILFSNNQFVYRLSWEDCLLHLCVHMPFFKTGIREYSDIYNIINSYTNEINWELFINLVHNIKAYDDVYRVFKILKSFYTELSYSQNFLDIINICEGKTSLFVKEDTLKRTADINFLLFSRSVYISKIEKNFILFFLTKNYNDKLKIWLKMWKSVLVVPNKEKEIFLCRADRRKRNYLFNNFLVIFLILKTLSKDHGYKFIISVTIKNALEIILGFFTFSFAIKKENKYDENLIKLSKELE